jgi:hypothetical protein
MSARRTMREAGRRREAEAHINEHEEDDDRKMIASVRRTMWRGCALGLMRRPIYFLFRSRISEIKQGLTSFSPVPIC